MKIQEDLIKGSGASIQYRTMTFADGSTIMVKAQTTIEQTAAGGRDSQNDTGNHQRNGPIRRNQGIRNKCGQVFAT